MKGGQVLGGKEFGGFSQNLFSRILATSTGYGGPVRTGTRLRPSQEVGLKELD